MYMKFTRFEVHAMQVLTEMMALKMRTTGDKEKIDIAFNLSVLNMKWSEIERLLDDPAEIVCLMRAEEHDEQIRQS